MVTRLITTVLFSCVLFIYVDAETVLATTAACSSVDSATTALHHIKIIAGSIKKEDAAQLYVNIYHDMIKKMIISLPDIMQSESTNIINLDDTETLFAKLMQFMSDECSDKTLDFAVAMYALPEEVVQQCNAKSIECTQNALVKFKQELYAAHSIEGNEDDELEEGKISIECVTRFHIKFLQDILTAVVGTLRNFYSTIPITELEQHPILWDAQSKVL